MKTIILFHIRKNSKKSLLTEKAVLNLLQFFSNFMLIRNYTTLVPITEMDGLEVLYEPWRNYEVLSLNIFY